MVKLEYGYYGGCSQHLGAYSYRGFDIVISSEYRDTPVEGLTFTLGLYDEGMEETDNLFDIEDFSMDNAIRCVDHYIDFLLSNGYKEPDLQIREMRKLLKHTHDMDARKPVEQAIEDRQKELAGVTIPVSTGNPALVGDARAIWDRLTYEEKLMYRYGYIDTNELDQEMASSLEDMSDEQIQQELTVINSIVRDRK